MTQQIATSQELKGYFPNNPTTRALDAMRQEIPHISSHPEILQDDYHISAIVTLQVINPNSPLPTRVLTYQREVAIPEEDRIRKANLLLSNLKAPRSDPRELLESKAGVDTITLSSMNPGKSDVNFGELPHNEEYQIQNNTGVLTQRYQGDLPSKKPTRQRIQLPFDKEELTLSNLVIKGMMHLDLRNCPLMAPTREWYTPTNTHHQIDPTNFLNS